MTARKRLPHGETRRRVFRLLVGGKSQAEAAQTLERHPNTVSEHAKKLVADGALKIVPGLRTPILYKRGPKADLVDHGLSVRKLDRVGWSGPGPDPKRSVRVHRGTYKVSAGNLQEVWDGIPWTKTWVASGVPNGRMSYVVGGRRYQFAASMGKIKQSVKIEPPEDFLADPSAVEQVELTRLKAAVAAVGKWARDHGVDLQGQQVQRIEPVEFGIETPGVEPFGRAGENGFWVDESPGKGRSEAETDMPAVAAAMLGLPDWKRVADQRFRVLEEGQAALQESCEKSIGVLEGVHATLDRHDAALKMQAAATVRQVSNDYAPEVA